MKRRWLLFTLEYLTSLHGTFTIKKSDISTRKQLERHSLTQQIAVGVNMSYKCCAKKSAR